MADQLLISGARLLDPSQGLDHIGDLFLRQGKVAWVGQGPPPAKGCQVLPAQGLVAAPGLVDLHCHLREPGFEEKETIATGTRAAARGGFTTVCCMPNTNPPLDSRAAVEFVKRTAQEQGTVQVLPIGCVTQGRAGKALAEMGELAEAGAVAFSDDGSPVADAALLRHALEYSRAFGRPVMEHCEDPALARGGVMNEGWVAARLGLRGMPAAAEEAAVARAIALARLTGGRLHVAHVSTAGSVALLRQAKAEGLPVTAEATPHHLVLTEDLVMGNKDTGLPSYDTSTKVNPPLRTRADTEALQQALREGVIDAIATDHAPHALVDKLCEYDQAAFGISGLETALGLVMALVHDGKLDLPTLVARLTQGPARVLGMDLGTLKPGSPADVVLFDPEREWVVRPEAFASKGRNTPLAGATLKGKVMATVCGGQVVYLDPLLKVEGKAQQ